MAVSEEEKQVLMRVDVILWMVKSSMPIGQWGTQTHIIQLLKYGNFDMLWCLRGSILLASYLIICSFDKVSYFMPS